MALRSSSVLADVKAQWFNRTCKCVILVSRGIQKSEILIMGSRAATTIPPRPLRERAEVVTPAVRRIYL